MTFLAATTEKERLKTRATKILISIGSRNALDFGSGMTFLAATAEKERLKTRASTVGELWTSEAE